MLKAPAGCCAWRWARATKTVTGASVHGCWRCCAITGGSSARRGRGFFRLQGCGTEADGGWLSAHDLLRARQRAELRNRGGIHCLRHSFATHLLEDGVDVLTIRPRQGNTNGPTHRLTLVGHSAECLHSCQSFVDTPGGTLALNCERTHGMRDRRRCGGQAAKIMMGSGIGSALNIRNARSPWKVPSDSVGSDILVERPSYPLNFRQLEEKDARPNAPVANGYSTR